MATKHPLTFTVTNAQIANVQMKGSYGKVLITTGDKVYVFSEFCGALRLEGIEDLNGRTITRGSEMEQWSEHRVMNDPTITLACAVIRGITKIRLGSFDEHPVILTIKDEATPQVAAQPEPTLLSKARLHLVLDRIGGGRDSGIYMKGRGARMLMSNQEAHAWLDRGAIDDMEVRVSIGAVETFMPLLQVAPMIDVNTIETSGADLLAKLFGEFLRTALVR